MLERFFLLLALARGTPQALILVGALKIGTRIRTEDSIDSDYYLVGNLVSASFALLYAAVLAVW